MGMVKTMSLIRNEQESMFDIESFRDAIKGRKEDIQYFKGIFNRSNDRIKQLWE